jgi:PAS domain S-box-containing protein
VGLRFNLQNGITMPVKEPPAAAKPTGHSTGIAPVFVVLAVVFALSAVAMFWMQRSVQAAQRAVVNQQMLIDDVRETLSTVKDAETGQRGFLLTGDESYLQPNVAARARIQKNLDQLDAGAGKGLLPAGAVKEYHQLVDEKFKELDLTINLRRTQGLEAALARVRTNTGKQFMDGLRRLTESLVESSNRIMAERRVAEERLSFAMVLLFWAIVLLNLGLLAWAFRRIHLEMGLRAESMLEANRQGELLRVTLASIGDGVIVTDEKGRISFMNDVAEDLCGWKRQDAIGRPCAEVFNIINETSREPVESPVDKVVELGVIVGLANHTLLISKDGSETPIDDSGAPIRDADGTLRGVVLVFRDFSEHKAAGAALREAMQDAQAANVAKDNFLATLSHELRTPLTPVVMTLATWMSSGRPPKPGARMWR